MAAVKLPGISGHKWQIEYCTKAVEERDCKSPRPFHKHHLEILPETIKLFLMILLTPKYVIFLGLNI